MGIASIVSKIIRGAQGNITVPALDRLGDGTQVAPLHGIVAPDGSLASLDNSVIAPGGPFYGDTTGQVIFDIDVRGYATATVTTETSSDYASYAGAVEAIGANTNDDWVLLTGRPLGSPLTGSSRLFPQSPSGGNHTTIYNINGAVALRLRISTIAAGNVTAHVLLGTVPENILTLVGGVDSVDAAPASNPVGVGGLAVSTTSSSRTNGRRTPITTDLTGRLLTKPYAPPAADWHYVTATGGIITNATATLKTAAGANVSNCIRTVRISNDSATATEIEIRDGAAGTVLDRINLPANTAIRELKYDPPLRSSANFLLQLVVITTGAKVYFSCDGHVETT